MECNGHHFLYHFGLFLPFYTPNDLKIQNFEKLKKTSGDIINLFYYLNLGRNLFVPIILICDLSSDSFVVIVIVTVVAIIIPLYIDTL